jgi:hypothetical protein
MSGLLAQYVQHCFDSGIAHWHARYVVVAVQTVGRHLKGHLRRAWDAVAAWHALQPIRSRLPLPLLVAENLALVLARQGCRRHNDGELYWCVAILVRLAFWGLCRPGEVLKLTVGDVCIPVVDSPEPLVIAIRFPKNRGALGRVQFRIIEDPGSISWCRWFLADLPSDHVIWPSSAVVFRRLFDWGLDILHLGHIKYTPASLRPGGTTHLFKCGVPLSTIKYRGGWAADRTLGCYVQEGMAALVWNSLPMEVSDALRAAAAADQDLLTAPPHVPWQSVFVRRRRSSRLTSRS